MANKVGRSIAIYLLRNDLRIHDNECLRWCVQNAYSVIPLFCLDTKIYGGDATTWTYKFPKTAAYRTQFVLQSLQNLRESYQRLGCDLVVRKGQTTQEAVLEMIQVCKKSTTGEKYDVVILLCRSLILGKFRNRKSNFLLNMNFSCEGQLFHHKTKCQIYTYV